MAPKNNQEKAIGKNGNGNGRRLVITSNGLIEPIYQEPAPTQLNAAQLNGSHRDLVGNGQ